MTNNVDQFLEKFGHLPRAEAIAQALKLHQQWERSSDYRAPEDFERVGELLQERKTIEKQDN